MNERTLRVLEYNRIKELLYNNANSLGKSLVEELMPSVDVDQVKDWLNETTQATLALVRRGNPPLQGISDITESLKKAKLSAILSPGELLKIAYVFKTVRGLKGYSAEARENQRLDVVDGLIDTLFANKSFEDNVTNAIISEEEISDSASNELRNIRRHIADTNSRIKDKLNQMIHSSKYQKCLQDNLVTIRDGRYVVPVKQEYRNEVPGLVHDSSSTGATLFIEPMAVVEANNKLKELKIQEKIEIEKILSELTALVAENIESLETNLSVLARLDFIFAKGKLGLQLNASEPVVNTEYLINLKKARHPLIDSKAVVPIDIGLGGKFNSLVITGPNTGGKTVTLKTVGLFILMAQSGLHIPVQDGSEVSVFNKVFADIGDEQSIEQNLSTFSAHMTNIVEIVKCADSSSLCLFDELGAGTDPTEGAALAMSILHYLHGMNAKTIATTHYSELKVFALTNEGFQNASCEFNVETLRPTYRVLMGVPGKSNAFEISRRLGLKENLIISAKEFISKEEIKFEDIINNLHKEKEIVEKEREKAQVYRRETQELKEELEKQRKEFEEKKQKMLLDARQEALEILESAKEESDEIIKEIRQLSKERDEREREKIINESRQKMKSRLGKEEEEITKHATGRTDQNRPPQTVKPGQKVYIVSIDQNGIVLTTPDEHGDVQVQVGIMKINSKLRDLRIVEEHGDNKKREADRFTSSKAISMKSEIDLRGQVLEEAILNVDKYLDDVYLSGISQVTIIHGKGTGTLRSGIHQFLRTHQHVKKFRLGKYGEGEEGVTIVEIK